MAHIVRSARGVRIDFDLLKIKQQISSTPKPTNVAVRESFIDQKFKRKLKKINRAASQEPVPRQEPDDVTEDEEQTEDED